MVQSLLIKLALLAAAVALVFWVGWPMPDEPGPEGDTKAPVPLPPPQGPSTSRADIGQGRVQSGGKASEDNGQAKSPARLDLNRATADDLEQLPGIGAVLAQRILEWRRGHGAFRSVDELDHVQGIGDKKLRQLKPLVTVSQAQPPRVSSSRSGVHPQVKGRDAQ
ncbi:MAG: helix-hairpin-helix domain-containing protein [Nitrospirae bacterium]|nr:MAG: helix-hairpin-helix domain-containing protein [Nitrospirota bacterium]